MAIALQHEMNEVHGSNIIADLCPLDPDADPVRDASTIVGELRKHDPALAANRAGWS